MSLAKTSPKRMSSRSSSFGKMLFFIAATAMAVAACGRLPIYSHYEHIDDGWRRDDTLTFTTAVRDSANYHLILGLRATNAYPYTQLTVNIDVNHQSSDNVHAIPSTFTIDITDLKGEMKGAGTSICQYDMPIGDVVLSCDDTLTVRVHHAMSRFSLPGISDIGLTVEQ